LKSIVLVTAAQGARRDGMSCPLPNHPEKWVKIARCSRDEVTRFLCGLTSLHAEQPLPSKAFRQSLKEFDSHFLQVPSV
jgi:hypothetical protein